MNKIIKFLVCIYVFLAYMMLSPFSVNAELSITNMSPERVDYNNSGAIIFGDISNTSNSLRDSLGNTLASQVYSYSSTFLRPNRIDKILFRNNNYLALMSNSGDSTQNRQNKRLFFDKENLILSDSNSQDTQVPRNCRLSYRVGVYNGNFIFQAYRRWVSTSQYCTNADFIVEYLPASGEVSSPATYTGDSINLKDINDIDGTIQIITDNRMIYKKSGDDDTIYQYSCNSFGSCTESPYIEITFLPGETPGIIQAFENKFVILNSEVYASINIYTDGPDGQAFYNSKYLFDSNGDFEGFSDSTGDWILNAFNDNGEIGLYRLNLEEATQENLIFDVSDTPLIGYSYNGTGYDIRYVRSGVLYDFESEPVFDFITSADGGNGLNDGIGGLSEVPENWTFTVGGYNFYESGFVLNNFLPDPYGGLLSFDIISPGQTLPERTEKFGSYEVNGNGYGFDSGVIINYPYHEVAGDYKVRVVYEYNGVEVFPFGESYNNYTITVPEVVGANPDDLLDWDYQACNDGNEDSSFLAGVSNFFLCSSQFIGNVVEGGKDIASGMISPIKRIIDAFGSLGEQISFNIIPSTYANNQDALDAWGEAFGSATVDTESNLYSPINFMKGLLFTILGSACIGLFILLIKD